MYKPETPPYPKLAYSIENLALACDIGRSTIFAAIQCGDLESYRPVINGKPMRRTLISPEAAQKWIDGFQSPAPVKAA
jgi:hypothetical protein